MYMRNVNIFEGQIFNTYTQFDTFYEGKKYFKLLYFNYI